MWLIFTAVAMLFCTAYELLGTRLAQSDKSYMALKLKISVIGIEFIAGVGLYFLGLGESGFSPFELIVKYPLIALSTSFTVISSSLYLWGVKYTGLSIQESLYGLSGVLIFLGIICVHVFTGRLSETSQFYEPYRLIPIIIMLAGICILPNLNRKNNRTDTFIGTHDQKDFSVNYSKLIKGLVITLAAVVFDAGDSLLTSVIMDEGNIGTVDYMIAAYMVASMWGMILYAYICFREKKLYNPFQKGNRSVCFYAVLIIFHTAFYLMGAYASPVKSTVLWCVYPIIPLIAARYILKEKYHLSERICIWITALASVVFCLSDTLM